jgi:hypothetical protein
MNNTTVRGRLITLPDAFTVEPFEGPTPPATTDLDARVRAITEQLRHESAEVEALLVYAAWLDAMLQAKRAGRRSVLSSEVTRVNRTISDAAHQAAVSKIMHLHPVAVRVVSKGPPVLYEVSW